MPGWLDGGRCKDLVASEVMLRAKLSDASIQMTNDKMNIERFTMDLEKDKDEVKRAKEDVKDATGFTVDQNPDEEIALFKTKFGDMVPSVEEGVVNSLVNNLITVEDKAPGQGKEVGVVQKILNSFQNVMVFRLGVVLLCGLFE